ncbi:HNH endonuclease signature motif containing protein [Deltaproteobacteria bacterium TL4]
MTQKADKYQRTWKELTGKVKEAFGWRCAQCHRLHGTAGRQSMLTVHHIDQNRDNNTKENLIALCKKCHKLIDKEAQLYYSKEKWQLEMFVDYTYLNMMRKLWQERLQMDFFHNDFDDKNPLYAPRKTRSTSQELIYQKAVQQKVSSN